MVEPAEWMSRTWTLGIRVDLFPQVLERLRGSPARAEELARSLPATILQARRDRAWSAQEHLGHLVDMNTLDDIRVTEFVRRADALTAADMTNRATENAQHNRVPVEDILRRLRSGRLALVRQLETLTTATIQHSVLHPRLMQRMSVVDWMFFIAEHDDHHLAHARYTAAMLDVRPQSPGSR